MLPTRHVVERCPRCGVEHQAPGDGTCEACGGALRPWCRAHGAETGWLDGPACPQCADEAARSARVPCPAPALPVTGVAAPPKLDARPPVLPERIAIGVLTTLATGFGVWVMGMAGGALYALVGAGTVQEAAPAWGRIAGMVGLLVGLVSALFYIIRPSAPPKK